MDLPNIPSVWIINTNFDDGIYEAIQCERNDKNLSFKLPAILPEPYNRSFNQFIENVKKEDLVVLSQSSNQINAIGIIGKHPNTDDIFLRRKLEYEFSVSWYQMKEIILPAEDVFKSKEYIAYFSQILEFIVAIKSVINQLPKEVIRIWAIIFKVMEEYKKPNFEKETIFHHREASIDLQYKDRMVFYKSSKAPPTIEPGGVVELFYAVNRGHSGNDKPNEFYTDEYVDTQYGICHVNIPQKHEVGEIERPTWWKLQFSESQERDVMLMDLHEVSKDEFASTLATRINEKGNKESLLFVHGYNNDFKQTAWRTGQIVFDLSFAGVSAFYSWPSAGDTIGYVHDLQMAQNCKPKLKEFIKLLLGIPGVEKLHIIAHSMGSYILASALDLLAGDTEIENKIDLIHQIILCAPDIDQKEFKEQIYPKFKTIGDQRTIYASSNDKALKASDVIREGLPRLGEGGDNLFVEDGIDTIDASNVPTDMLGHGYFAQTKELINDIFHIVKNELKPEQRNLRKRNTKDQLTYWLFPE